MTAVAPMAELDRLLGEFADAWNAGERPRLEDFVDRAPPERGDELAELIEAFLAVAPSPRYSEETMAELMREPAVLASVESARGRSGLLPSLLPRLRERARLRRDEVVERLAATLRVPGTEPKMARYLHQLESGTLEAGGVSRRVFEALAYVLGARVEEIERAADVPGLGGGTGPAPAFMRSIEASDAAGEPPALAAAPAARAAHAQAADEDWDEVDRLFRGGRGDPSAW